MSVSLPVRSHPSHAETSYSREEVIAAIQDFYELLIKLPFISSKALVLPPKEGWSGVNAQELRRRGKTEEVIGFLQHLPYLRAPQSSRQWMIGPDTVEIAYCDGELYKEWSEENQPVPGHCIMLTEPDARGGLSLVFDTKTGTITQLSNVCETVMLDCEEYDNLPLQDQWMAHATMPATDLFRLWKRRFEKLSWMALYNPHAQGYIAEWWTYRDEEDMPASDDGYNSEEDDDYDPEGEKIEDIDEGGRESDSEDGMNIEDEQVLEEEVDGLMDDAGDDSYQRRIELQSQQNIVVIEATDLPPSKPTDQRPSHRANYERKREEVYTIHKSNGWPSNFDREKCRIEIAQFLQRQESGSHSLEKFLFDENRMVAR